MMKCRRITTGVCLTLLIGSELLGAVDDYLAAELPDTFRGWPTRFPTTGDPTARHRVEVNTPYGFAAGRLGSALIDRPDATAWLSASG